jgi:hypothetical protein
MAHEIAKLQLERARTLRERTEAVEAAIRLGMPLHEIEAHLDWLDQVRRNGAPPSDADEENGPAAT